MTMLKSESEAHAGLANGAPRRADEITVARWTDARTQDRRAAVVAPDGQFVLGVVLRPTRARLLSGRETIFDGVMASGVTYVCRPSQTLHAEFAGPADILNLYFSGGSIHKHATAEINAGAHIETSRVTILARDALIEHLARALQTAEDEADANYIQTLARAIVMRAAQIRQGKTRVLPLPKWRMRRVIDYVESHISETISLADLAAAAGLSRTHFTAQFRLATSCKPHDFILLQRIEIAQRLLLQNSRELFDIALTVGFQTQAHFSTVFKRFMGEAPGRWRRAQLAECSQRREVA
ncbi:MAG TPA: AraC family transcriptional regulator [Steroidobacteraceae bacterium]